MTIDEYKDKLIEIESEAKVKVVKLNNQYVKENAEFEIGDFIYNVTGIIKIESIEYSNYHNYITIEYYGYRYKNWGGKLTRTKNRSLSKLVHNLKLLKPA